MIAFSERVSYSVTRLWVPSFEEIEKAVPKPCLKISPAKSAASIAVSVMRERDSFFSTKIAPTFGEVFQLEQEALQTKQTHKEHRSPTYRKDRLKSIFRQKGLFCQKEKE